MKTVVLIPAYNPDAKMPGLIERLADSGLDCVLVNDGSDDAHTHLFDEVSRHATVIGYTVNHGKGYALKYGIRYIMDSMPDAAGFVTADADGQHSVGDIIRVANELENGKCAVLGVRDLSGDIPLRSRIGNDMSRVVYTLVTGKYLRDNQSGLRGFSVKLAPWLLSVGGSRYEYEMNVLTEASAKSIKITEIPIETIYEAGNKTSHFNPIRDTARIQGRLIIHGTIPALFYIFLLVGLAYICRAPDLILINAALFWSCSLLFVRCVMLHRRSTGKGQKDYAEAVAIKIFTAVHYSIATTAVILLWYLTHSMLLGVAVAVVLALLLTYGLAFAYYAVRGRIVRRRLRRYGES